MLQRGEPPDGGLRAVHVRDVAARIRFFKRTQGSQGSGALSFRNVKDVGFMALPNELLAPRSFLGSRVPSRFDRRWFFLFKHRVGRRNNGGGSKRKHR